MTNYIVVY